MNMQPMAPVYSHNTDFIQKVFGYVALAFGLASLGTFAAAQYIPVEMFSGMKPWILYIAVLILAWTSHKWSMAARPVNFLMFVLFSGLMGVMFYPLLAVSFAVGGMNIVIKAFGITALMTLAAGVYGKTTSKDLSGLGGFFSLAILGLIITSVINAFWFNGMVEMIISGVGVVLFSGLIAYQVNMLKHYPEDRAMEAGISLFIAIFNLLTSVLRLLMAFGRD